MDHTLTITHEKSQILLVFLKQENIHQKECNLLPGHRVKDNKEIFHNIIIFDS